MYRFKLTQSWDEAESEVLSKFLLLFKIIVHLRTLKRGTRERSVEFCLINICQTKEDCTTATI